LIPSVWIKTMATTTQQNFLERLAQSQLLDEKQLRACRAAAGDNEEALRDYLLKQGWLTRFQVRQLRAGATKFHVGKYVITDCLGRGGNGIVYKARHCLMQRYVALKTLDTRNLHHGSDALARFQREIDIVARLEHPNVVRAFDVLQTRTHLYLVLEFIAGRDLGAVVKERGPLRVRKAVNFAVQAARGLQYAHSQGIVHRDLKPANLLLTTEGVVKLADLGLAKLCEDSQGSEVTMKGLCVGTPEYMAPEQAEDAHNVDPRSDLYSLGATLFHLLTGQLPVKGNSYLHRLKLLLAAPPLPLLEARPDAPPELAAIVDRLRERDPARRPATAAEVIALLEPFARKTPLDNPNTWPGQRKTDVVMAVLSGHTTAAEACCKHRIPPADLERWQQTFVEAGILALNPQQPTTPLEQMQELHAKISAHALEIEQLKKQLAAGSQQ
jgi:serine/threonine protein kinase